MWVRQGIGATDPANKLTSLTFCNLGLQPNFQAGIFFHFSRQSILDIYYYEDV